MSFLKLNVKEELMYFCVDSGCNFATQEIGGIYLHYDLHDRVTRLRSQARQGDKPAPLIKRVKRLGGTHMKNWLNENAAWIALQAQMGKGHLSNLDQIRLTCHQLKCFSEDELCEMNIEASRIIRQELGDTVTARDILGPILLPMIIDKIKIWTGSSDLKALKLLERIPAHPEISMYDS